MRISIKLTVLLIFLYSCSTLGTKTLYKTKDEFRISKIGFCRLDGENHAGRMFYKMDEIFDSTVIHTFIESGLEIPVQIQTDISYESPELPEIIELCYRNDLDGFLLARLLFTNRVYTVNMVPVGQNIDTEVELKLYDKNGKLLIVTSHNTFQGNSYMMPPPPSRTIHDGAKGAVKRLIKEMN